MKETLNQPSYDLIGDIHGYAEPLKRLLNLLGYKKTGDSFRHSEGRKVIFLGDFIDRGPAIRETLQIVKSMVDADQALAVMGNHEYNAICYHTPDGKGDFLRSRSKGDGKNTKQHRATLDAFADFPAEWEQWIEWFKELPFYLDLGNIRAVHASWNTDLVDSIKGQSLTDSGFLKRTAIEGTEEFSAIETLLKGVEVSLPEGNHYEDKEGFKRDKMRVKWWHSPVGKTFREVGMPYSESIPSAMIPKETYSEWQPYSENEPPVFVGHYWMPGDWTPEPLASNVSCLDYSVAKDGALTAYRWDREREIDPAKFVQVRADVAP